MVLKSRFPDIAIPNVSVSNYCLELFNQGENSTAYVNLYFNIKLENVCVFP